MIVADSGPIISLARVDLLNILPALLGQVVLPPAIFAEITALPDKPGAAAVRAAQWVRIEAVSSDAANLPLARVLGPGERDAIRLARALGAVLILDEHGHAEKRRAWISHSPARSQFSRRPSAGR